MAIQSEVFSTSFGIRSFSSTKHIATKQHMAVWLKKVSDDLWTQLSVNKFELINNSAVLTEAPSSILYSQVEIRVADEPDELGSSQSDIAVVASVVTQLQEIANTVVPNITEILLSDDNAVIATTKASEASTSASEALASKNTAVTSATTATTQAGIATTKASEANASAISADADATIATTQAGIATTQANLAISAFDSFDDRYLGAKASAPTLDNDGNALLTGALYYDSTSSKMNVYTGSMWKEASSAVQGIQASQVYTATAGQTVFNIAYDVGYVNIYVNGLKLAPSDFTATNGTSITLAVGATLGDTVECLAFGTFELANVVSKNGDTMTGNLVFASGTKIQGDFSNATLTNRVAFQTSNLNTNTNIQIIPNGTGLGSQHWYHYGSDILNTSRGRVGLTASNEMWIMSEIVGTASYAPIVMFTGGAERLRIDTSGNVLVTGSGGLGYGTGSGGTVTQLTSKSTAVTLNKPCGDIITHNASLASGATADFIVNNSLVQSTDTVLLCQNYSTLYSVRTVSISNGSFRVLIKNEHTAALAETVRINFAIIKGATA